MQIKDVEKLKAWLLTKLEPLCDADPAALAKYVVALLRKDKPKSALKELCVDQLEVFLAKETILFVDRLFRALESESYLTGRDAKTPSPEPTPPNPSSQQAPKPPPPRPAPPAAAKSQPATTAASRSGTARDGAQSSSALSGSERGGRGGRVGGGGGGGAGRKFSEDPRSREVDDEDRDFRRSRGRGGRPGDRPVRGIRDGVTVSREPDSSTGGGRRGAEPAGVKGHSGTVSTSGDIRGKRRRGEGEGAVVGGVSSTGSRAVEGVSRRIVREKARPHSDGRPSRRTWPHRSRSRSRSSSSESSSSTASSHDHSRKRSRHEWKERSSSSWGALGASSEGTKAGDEEREDEEAAEGGEGKRKRCKDYDEKGFCMLGDQCPFDHGVDPVVIGNNIPHAYPPPPSMVGIPSLALTKPDIPSFLVPPASHTGRTSPTESTTDGYNPEEPGLTATTTSPTSFLPGPLLNPGPLLPRPFPHTHPPHMQGVPTLPPLPPVGAFPPPLPPAITSTSHQFHHPTPPHSHWPRPPQQSFSSMPRQPSDTLIVRKIPRESNSITKLSSHFEKFGTIVNLTVWYGGDPEGALVQFSTPFEARKAHDSAEAVLNNRFIKIYYLRKDAPSYPPPPQSRDPTVETPGGVAVNAICGAPQQTAQHYGSQDHTPSLPRRNTKPMATLTPSVSHGHTHSHAPSSTHHTLPQNKTPSAHTYVSSTAAKTSASHPAPHQVPGGQRKRKAPDTPESKEMAKKRQELQRKTGELLQKQLDQQKVLISKLEKGGKQMSTEERKKIMKTIKTLSGNIEKLKKMASEAMEARLKSKQTPPSPTSPTPPSPSLTEKAQALRQEAHQLGLIPSPSQTTPTPGHVTGSHVTGDPSRGGQAKDLRSVLNKKQKRLLVLNAENRDQLMAHFDTFGGLVSVEVDPENSKNLIFSFRNAHLAQKAAKHSSSFNGKPLIMKWYLPKPPAPSSPYSHAPPSITSTPLQPPPPSLSLPLSSSNITTATSGTPEVTTPTVATPTLTKLDPEDLHLVEDDEEEEGEERSWRR